MHSTLRSATVFIALMLAWVSAGASTVAIDPGNGLAGGSNGYFTNGVPNNYTLGFRFTTTQALRLTELGMFDFNGGGPGTDRQVGLFELIGGNYQLLTSTHFLAAEQATHHIGSYSYHDVDDLDLLTGHTYAIMASGYYGGVQNPVFLRSTTTLNGISYGSGLYNVTHDTSDAFAGPNFFSDNIGADYYSYMGANFLWASSAAPEPDALALAGMALGLLTATSRRPGAARSRRG